MDPNDPLTHALGDNYVLERELGRGGMATVFLARDRKHGRQVALKVFRPELADPLGPERFLREIQIAARLQHPHILPVFDSGQANLAGAAGHRYWYTMPYVPGESLRDRIRRQPPLSLTESLSIARAVGAALDYAHRQQVVHRDIKPGNIMLHENEAVVADFGIAKALGAVQTEATTQALTGAGLVLGTPAYMSPEQASGDPDVDGRSDIYSLGCVLYEMLSGAPPFEGPTAHAVVVKHLSEPVPSIRTVRADLPEPVERLIVRALAKSVDDRFATAARLVEALGDTGTRPASAAAPPPRPGGRSVAVLPFRSLSSDREDEIFADGIAEEISNALTRLGSLRVAARTSAVGYKATHKDVRLIGQELGVDHVLEGSVRKGGSRLRVTAQLVEVVEGYQLWSERYDRVMDDIFAIQDDIAASVAEALRIVLTHTERQVIAAVPAAEIRAYEYYLRGRQRAHQFEPEGIEAALKLYARAVEIDPGYAPAHAAIAECYTWLYMYLDASDTHLRLAEEASRKALERDPNSAEAHAARGIVISLGQNFQAARAEFEAALRLAPGLYEAHYLYGRACFAEGLLADAARHFEQAATLRPEDYVAPSLLGSVYNGLGDPSKGHDARRRAVAACRRQLELYPRDGRALYLGAGDLRQLGEEAEALDWAARALSVAGNDPSACYNLACFYALGRDEDKAFECLDRAVELGYSHKAWLENDEDLGSLRESPRYAAFLERLSDARADQAATTPSPIHPSSSRAHGG